MLHFFSRILSPICSMLILDGDPLRVNCLCTHGKSEVAGESELFISPLLVDRMKMAPSNVYRRDSKPDISNLKVTVLRNPLMRPFLKALTSKHSGIFISFIFQATTSATYKALQSEPIGPLQPVGTSNIALRRRLGSKTTQPVMCK